MVLFTKIMKFFQYWLTRYLLATELYMVEPWEKVVVHIVASTLFAIVWFFNWSVLLSFLGSLRCPTNWRHILSDMNVS